MKKKAGSEGAGQKGPDGRMRRRYNATPHVASAPTDNAGELESGDQRNFSQSSRIEEADQVSEEGFSDTAPGIVVLGKYVGALYLSVFGQVRAGILKDLEEKTIELKEHGEKAGDFAIVPDLPGGPLKLRSIGRVKYKYVLWNETIHLEATTWSKLPALMIQFKSHALYSRDLSDLDDLANATANFFLEPGFSDCLNRFDLAVDFQGEGWNPPELDDVISRVNDPHVRYQKVHGRNIPTCMTFGKSKSALQVQIYNKTEELLSSGKDWMRRVWDESGRYDENIPVWRLEYRFYRKRLRDNGVDTITDLGIRMGALLRGVVGEPGLCSWIRVASPETRGFRQNRRHAVPWWDQIREATLEGMPEVVRSPIAPGPMPAVHHTRKVALGHVVRLAALEGISNMDDLMDLLEGVLATHLENRGLSFEEAIARKRNEIEARYSSR